MKRGALLCCFSVVAAVLLSHDLAYATVVVGAPKPTARPTTGAPDPKTDRISLIIESAGSSLAAEFHSGGGLGRRPTAVLLHGFPGVKRDLLGLPKPLIEAGWNVLEFNYRGTWGSKGAFSPQNSLQDVAAVVDFLRSARFPRALEVDAQEIALVGHSFGGAMALLTASDDPSLACVASIAGVNIGALARKAAVNPEIFFRFAATFDSGGNRRATDGEAIVADLAENADRYDLIFHRDTLAASTVLLVASARDDLPLHHIPLVEALRDAEASHLTELTMKADHNFRGARKQLRDAVVTWLTSECGN